MLKILDSTGIRSLKNVRNSSHKYISDLQNSLGTLFLDSLLVITGGENDENLLEASVEVVDLKHQTKKNCGIKPMPHYIYNHQAVTFQDKLVSCYGYMACPPSVSTCIRDDYR